MRPRVLALGLALLLVTAGCAAPTPNSPTHADSASSTDATDATATTTTSSSDSSSGSNTSAETTSTATDNAESGESSTYSDIEIKNGSLPVDATSLYGQVLDLLDEDVTPPLVIEIRSHESMVSAPRSLPPFAQLMGISSSGERETVAAAGVTQGSDYVGLNARLLDDETRTRDVLVHEYVHVVQFKQGYITMVRENSTGNGTDTRLTRLAIIEGSPVYVEEAYLQQYTETEPTAANGLGPAYKNATGVRKYALAPYYFGWRYVRDQAGNASNITPLYRNPPNTTEAVIHGYAAGEELPRALSTNASGVDWRLQSSDRLGELFLRHALVTELDSDHAAVAAAGWGNDEHLAFKNGSQSGYVWAIRWDSPAEADEFETAMNEYLDARGEQQDGRWQVDETVFRVDRTSPETVTLIIGPPDFTNAATVDGTNSTVTVAT